jgi:hypothetical protein
MKSISLCSIQYPLQVVGFKKMIKLGTSFWLSENMKGYYLLLPYLPSNQHYLQAEKQHAIETKN